VRWLVLLLLFWPGPSAESSLTVNYLYGDEHPVVVEMIADVDTHLRDYVADSGYLLAQDDDPMLEIRVVPRYDADRLVVGADANLTLMQVPPELVQRSPMLYSAYPTTGIGASPEDIARLAAGMLLYAAGDCVAAIPYFEPFLARYFTDARLVAGFYLGNCALMDGAYDRAILVYRSLCEMPIVPTATNLAWAYIQAEQPTLARIHLDTALDMTEDPHDRASAYESRAWVHALHFDYDAALADIDRAVELLPDDPGLYVTRGQIVLLLYEWERVLTNYDAALELDPTYAEAYFYRGVLHYSNMPVGLDREAALADFERYLDLAADGPHAAEARRYAESIRTELEALSEN
jgi:tetratricopeptide (TPR) repeat protein